MKTLCLGLEEILYFLINFLPLSIRLEVWYVSRSSDYVMSGIREIGFRLPAEERAQKRSDQLEGPSSLIR